MEALPLRAGRANCMSNIQHTSSSVVACAGVAGGKALSNNNNDALLSQTWVIAKATVLRVRTVPYVEPYTFG